MLWCPHRVRVDPTFDEACHPGHILHVAHLLRSDVLHPPAPAIVALGIRLAPQADDEGQRFVGFLRMRHGNSFRCNKDKDARPAVGEAAVPGTLANGQRSPRFEAECPGRLDVADSYRTFTCP